MHAGFNQFAAFNQDAIDNKTFIAKGNLTVPVGPTMAEVMRRGRNKRH